MRLHFASISAHGDTTAEAELNRFLAGHRVTSVERHLVEAGAASVWAICVAYMDGDTTSDSSGKKASPARIDYREVLSEREFAVFAKLRSLRKSMADQEGVPPYALFTNEHLAAMVQRPVTTLAELGRIDGVGKGRIDKYGQAFLSALQAALKEDGSRAPNGGP